MPTTTIKKFVTLKANSTHGKIDFIKIRAPKDRDLRVVLVSSNGKRVTLDLDVFDTLRINFAKKKKLATYGDMIVLPSRKFSPFSRTSYVRSVRSMDAFLAIDAEQLNKKQENKTNAC